MVVFKRTPMWFRTKCRRLSLRSHFADVVDHVRGAVVSVKVKTTETADASEEFEIPHITPGDPLERFFKHFGEEGRRNRHLKPHVTQAQGSGFIISADGYVVTNHHVVENATEVSVTLDDGKTVPATIVGTDKKTDLALLKIKEGGPYQYVDFAKATPRVGDWVIAVGNPFGLGGTVTAGIVSARGRDIGAGPYDDFLQIDAPVNRGNSGGPTFNTQGQVVGINTAIFSPSGGSVGIGFAIPAETAQNCYCRAGKIKAWSRGAGLASRFSQSPRKSPIASASSPTKGRLSRKPSRILRPAMPESNRVM